MDLHMTLIGAIPLVLALLWRLMCRPQPKLTGLVREVRDVVTLRMVLRDSEPDQRPTLVAAHRAWRTEPVARAGTRRTQ